MRVLGIETTSLRGSVALYEDQSCIAYAFHNQKNQHAELMLGLIDQVFSDSNTNKRTIDRIAVGVGPGTFTGIRVGLSLAAGFQIATNAEGVGVHSLASISRNIAADEPRTRLIVLDARREEYFVALYTHYGDELIGPTTVSHKALAGFLLERFVKLSESLNVGCLLMGDEPEGLLEYLQEASSVSISVTSSDYWQPDARSCALIGQSLSPADYPLQPLYLRGANAKRPDLPASPLLLPRS